MKSTVSIKGHPLHPILVSFPIAFFTGTVLFDVLAITTQRESYRRTAQYLETAGIVSALAAAVPGFTDYLFTVPPKSSASKRGAKHGLLNVSMLSLFSTALALRRKENVPPLAVLALELAGLGIMTAAGWMGGTLVYRNQIGVYNRYADLGKWKEQRLLSGEGATELEVADADELKLNQMKLLHINGKRIVLGRTEQGYVAFDDHCTHRGGSLAGGVLICGIVQCPWHGSQFDTRSGAVKSGPAEEPISAYPLSSRNGKIMLSLKEPE
jgi:uncharacterized membrane protein/nitrite reductase/ring-hydroxylating ferredoxin subunit